MHAFRATGLCTGHNENRKRRSENNSQQVELQQIEVKRARTHPQVRKRDSETDPKTTTDKNIRMKKRIKRNPNRKRVSSYIDRMNLRLPTIQEDEWEKEHHVRKK